MTYLADFIVRIDKNDYPGFLKLWEEYCYSDEFDVNEYKKILQTALHSSLVVPFGKHVEKGLILWKKIPQGKDSHDVLKLLFQIQTTNSESLYEIAIAFLQESYPNDPNFHEKLRMIGLRQGENFQGAIGNYELLTHFSIGNFVYHSGGLGASEIVEVSAIREEIAIECEQTVGVKHLSFSNAFKTLIPITKDHFLARRFGDPDLLEKEAKENPAEVIRALLHDLGPKTAAEIKEELLDLVIPEKDWNRWWQNTRTKLKKDTKISCPKNLRLPFSLLDEAVPHEVAFYKALETRPSVPKTIQMVYTFLRDFSETLKNKDFKLSLEKRIEELLQQKDLNEGEVLSLLFFLEDLKVTKKQQKALDLIKNMGDPIEFLKKIEVVSFKKRALSLMRKVREDWVSIFFSLLFPVEQNLIRDYLLQEIQHKKEELLAKIQDLLRQPLSYPDVFVWYFQKLLEKNKDLPYNNPKGLSQFFEGFLILLDHAGRKTERKDLGKKMLGILLQNRYKVVRDIMKDSSLEEVKEFLLLATKCELLSDHDTKIIYSLAEVVYPSLSEHRKTEEPEEEIIWTTQEGYQKTKERVEKIATVDTLENAKEIEEARSHGDLKENSEFKFALEKRARLQAELKSLSDQLQLSRIITQADISKDQVGIGSVVECKNGERAVEKFTILGPWDANPDKNILSFQSKLAKTMEGLSVGETFSFQGKEFEILKIYSYLEAV